MGDRLRMAKAALRAERPARDAVLVAVDRQRYAMRLYGQPAIAELVEPSAVPGVFTARVFVRTPARDRGGRVIFRERRSPPVTAGGRVW